MIARGLIFAAALLASAGTAFAQAPVERGKYLVNTILTCQNCHTPKGERGAPVFERDLSSGLTWDEPPFKVTASNITQDKDTGIGSWSDADIKKALQKGERPNGVRLAAIMPSDFYEILTPGDLNAIVAYLQDREAGEAGDADADLSHRAAAPHPAGRREAVHRRRHGRQGEEGLLSRHHRALHGVPHADGAEGRDFEASYGKGGFEFPGPWGKSVSRNITSHKEKGIGAWSDDEIKRAITKGVSKDGSRLKPPMGYEFYANMTEADLDAIVAYLRTVPAKE